MEHKDQVRFFLFVLIKIHSVTTYVKLYYIINMRFLDGSLTPQDLIIVQTLVQTTIRKAMGF